MPSVSVSSITLGALSVEAPSDFAAFINMSCKLCWILSSEMLLHGNQHLNDRLECVHKASNNVPNMRSGLCLML